MGSDAQIHELNVQWGSLSWLGPDDENLSILTLDSDFPFSRSLFQQCCKVLPGLSRYILPSRDLHDFDLHLPSSIYQVPVERKQGRLVPCCAPYEISVIGIDAQFIRYSQRELQINV